MKALIDSLNYLLVVPVGLFFVIAAIVCGVKGARRGPVRALISVLLTLLSAVIAVFVCRVLSSSLLGLADRLAGGGVFDFSAYPEEANRLLTLIVKAAAAGLLFSLVFAVIALLVKCITNGIINGVQNKGKSQEEAREAQKEKSAGFKWSGALISIFVDALLLSVLLYLPLYGTAARLAKSAETAAESGLADDFLPDNEELQKGLAFTVDNPVLSATRVAPLSLAYDQIFAASDGDLSVSIGSLWESLEGVLENVGPFMASDGTDMTVNRSLASALQKALADNAGARSLLASLASDALLPTLGDSPYASAAGELLDAFGADVAPNKKEEELDSFTLLAGTVRRIMEMSAEATPVDPSEEAPAADDSSETFGLVGDLLEALARHPNIGTDRAMGVFKDMVADMGEEASAILNDDILKSLGAELEQATRRPVGEGRFGEVLKVFFLSVQTVSGSFSAENSAPLRALLLADKNAVLSVSGMLSTDAFIGMGIPKTEATKTSAIGSALLSAIADTELTEEEATREAEGVGAFTGAIMSASISSTTSFGRAISDAQAFLDNVCTSQIANKTVRNLVDAGFGIADLGTPVSAPLKNILNGALKTYYASKKAGDSGEILESLNNLADFLGLAHVK